MKSLFTRNCIDDRIYGHVEVGQMKGFLYEKTLDQ